MISFARGAPAPECIPVALLADCARAAVEQDATALAYGPAGGYGPLREWLGEQHGVDAGRVLIGNGGLQALGFVAEALLAGESRRVLVEGPTYDRTLTILARLGAEVEAVPMDAEGLDLDALAAALDRGPRPAFVYTIPTFQNPSGRTLGLDRRRELVALARDRGVALLEDDPYRLVRFDGEPLPTLHELAGGEGVVHASSFSKTVAPGLRVGYAVLPAELVPAVEAVAAASYITPVLLGQATVWEVIRRGRFFPNVERVRALLRARRDAMLSALERDLPPETSWSRPEGGYFVWAELGVDTGELLARAADAGVAIVRGSDFFPGGRGGTTSARLAYSFVSPAEIGEGVARLAALL
ncbi:MAG TPA: PLP-dependent aminotransferase family protein [Gaiellaceae bacterium]|nr:PLP-dependent aminotransferase family protein [Gaiellaceae bacterium]